MDQRPVSTVQRTTVGPSSFVLYTSKHSSHDSIWLLQNSNSDYVCFACIVETLGNEDELNYRKRKLLHYLLDLLAGNSLIWTLLANNSAILRHTGKVLLGLLTTRDSDLSMILVETLSVLAKKSKEDSAISLLDALIELLDGNISTQLDHSANQICLLGKILKNSNAVHQKVLNQHQWLLENLAQKIAKRPEKEAISYWYIFSQIYGDGNGKRINEKVSKLIVESMPNAIIASSTRDLQLNIISVATNFLKDPLLKEQLLLNEDEDSALHGKQFIEGIKKLLLSSHWEVQVGILQCINQLINCKVMETKISKLENLAECFVDKGVCEYLFDLLSSSCSAVLSYVLTCLIEFTNHKKFFTAGHLIYGLDPIIALLNNISSRKDGILMNKALTLISQILKKADRLLIGQLSVLNKIIAIFNKLCPLKEIYLLVASVSCLKEIFGLLPMLDEISIEIMQRILESFGKMLLASAKTNHGKSNEKEQQLSSLLALITVVQSSYNLINKTMTFYNKNQESKCDSKYEISSKPSIPYTTLKSLKNYIYFITDTYVIPITVLWLQIIDSQNIFMEFFNLLTCLVDNSECLSFARKLLQSSFIKLSMDVESKFYNTDSEQSLILCIDNFLINLVCKLEESSKATSLKLMLSETLPSLHIPVCEWPMFFTRKSSSIVTTNLHILKCCQIASLALAYCAARHGDCLWRSEVIIRALASFLFNQSDFNDLLEISKVHLIYLWSKACKSYIGDAIQPNSTQKFIISYLNRCDNIEAYYFYEGFYLHWIFMSELNYESKKRILMKSLMHDEINRVKPNLQQQFFAFRENADFYMMCADIIATSTKDQVAKCSQLVFDLLRGMDYNSGCFSLPVKHFIHRCISSNVSCLHHINLSALIDLYRTLPLTHNQKLAEIDLKFAYGACIIFADYPYCIVRLSVLNCFIYFLRCMQFAEETIPQVALLCNDTFLRQISSILPQKLQFVDSAVEKLNAASLVFVGELINLLTKLRSHSQKISIFIIQKEILITGLICEESPCFRMACLHFWKLFFDAGENKRNFLSFQGNDSNLNNNEMKMLLIYLQNLLVNDNILLRQLSLHCLRELLNNSRNDKLLKSPWNAFVMEQVQENLLISSDRMFNLQCILMLYRCGYSTSFESLCNKTRDIIRQETEKKNNDMMNNLLLQLIFLLVDNCQLSEAEKDDFDRFLLRFQDNTCELQHDKDKPIKTDEIPFIVYCDVLFPWTKYDAFEDSNITRKLAQYREKLTSF